MPDIPPDKKRNINVLHLLPNLVTISAIRGDLSAIGFGDEGDFELAVRLVLVACLLDGLDGRIARLTKSGSPIGAELESLADFPNVGVAPALIVHHRAPQGLARGERIAVPSCSMCCVLRLARFDVDSRSEKEGPGSDYFVGVPSPAGAGLNAAALLTYLWATLALMTCACMCSLIWTVLSARKSRNAKD